MAEPVKGVAYDFPVGLDSVLATGFQVNPTIAAGDFQISKDFGTFANLATLPVVTPPGSTSVKVSLSALEMTADKILILAKDTAGDEWDEMQAFIETPVSTSQSVIDILEGDHIENSINLIINKKGTVTPVLSKKITGSLLIPSATIRTTES